MARPRSEYLRATVKISLPAALAARLNLILEDPLTRRRKYGALSTLVTALLEDWFARQAGEASQTSIPTLSELQEELND